jgi:hypothetical protein
MLASIASAIAKANVNIENLEVEENNGSIAAWGNSNLRGAGAPTGSGYTKLLYWKY